MMGIIGSLHSVTLLDLFTQDGYILGSLQAQADSITFDIQHTERNVVSYENPFIYPSSQYQHLVVLLWVFT